MWCGTLYFGSLGHFAVEIHRIGEPVPGFDTNKGGVLADGLPNEPHRCGRSHAGIATSLAIEHFDGLDLPRIEAAREALRNNYNATASATEVVDRLRAIREELVNIREELGSLQ